MQWDVFQRKAKAAVPKQDLKPNQCWIGVLRHELCPKLNFSEQDFIWIIGHKVRISVVFDSKHRT
jgi:hypothetical protein